MQNCGVASPRLEVFVDIATFLWYTCEVQALPAVNFSCLEGKFF